LDILIQELKSFQSKR